MTISTTIQLKIKFTVLEGQLSGGGGGGCGCSGSGCDGYLLQQIYYFIIFLYYFIGLKDKIKPPMLNVL